MADENTEVSEEEIIPEDGILLAWEVPEFVKQERGTKWWIAAIAILVLLLIYALATANFVFAIILVMGGILLFMTSQREPEKIPFVVTVQGIVIGDRMYPFTDFTGFSILYQPPHLDKLYLMRKRGLRSLFTISLEGMDPNAVRETLSLFIDENTEFDEEPLHETLIRMGKL